MKDIKSLYLTAKSSGKQADITAYIESIQDLIENDPNSYITQLEYIISSDIGLKTVKPFIEKNGFPIACYDKMIECLNECVRKCEVYKKDSSIYTEALAEFENFRKSHINCFMMFENFSSNINENYVKTYYGKNAKGIQNRKLAAGMIKHFGEAAIPDALITAESINTDAVLKVLEFVDDTFYTESNSATIYEWVLTICNDISGNNYTEDAIKHMKENCLSAVVDGIKAREHQLYRESVILDRNDLVMEYSENDLKAIKNLISFKEYQMTWADEITEKSIINIQQEIYDLYEMFDGIIEEDVANSIIGMLPNATNGSSIDEATWIVNTRNKKTGEIPGYLAKNHDINYGEEDQSKKSSDKDKETSLDDYRRPSASNNDNKPAESLNIPSAYNAAEEIKDTEPTSSGSQVSEEDKKMINNYYYYTYTNSLNKNTNSYNKDHSVDNSVRDNHSTRDNSVKDNHSTRDNSVRDNSVRDNHSTRDNHSVTHLNSHNTNNGYSLIPDENEESEEDKPKEESVQLEAVGDADDGKPKSDHPVKDILTDIDRETTKKQQEAKKKVQDAQNVVRAATKPIKRTETWIANMINKWKDADENNVKEKMADPHARNNLFSAIKKAIAAGSLLKAGILMNPIFLTLTVTRGAGKNKREFRIRNEMIGELKTELEIIDEKIRDANNKGDNAEKYKLMRFKNELNKKLIRVGGNKAINKMI
jgi:hypothetical protein